jgi:hypothetical protein
MFSYTLNEVKRIKNYGISINGNTYDPIFTKGFLSSSPNVSIIGTSCYIDYSNTTNISDLTFLKRFFGISPTGTTFYLAQGDYYDESKDVRLDISGVFSKVSCLNDDKLIVGGIVSGFTYNTNYSYFNRNNFVKVPQYTTGYTGGATAANYLLNNLTSNPEKSFINAGLIGSFFGKEEYLEIEQSAANTGKIKINSATILKDNKELVYLNSSLTNENLGTTYSNCVVYIRGNSNPIVLNYSRKESGCYVVYDDSGNQINCFENQNRLQAFLRAQSEDESYSSYWVPCLDCSRLSDNAINAATSDRTLHFDASVFFYVTEQSYVTLNNSAQYQIEYSYTLVSNANGNDSLTPTPEINFNIDYGFKLDLSHPSLKQFSVEAYSDSSKSVPMTQHIFKMGVPGYDQSGLIYQKTSSSPKIIYLEFSGPTTFNVVIKIQ